MGFRTVVMLSNDMCNEWSKDQELGQKIQADMNCIGYRNRLGNFGRVVECTHADTQTLAVLTHYEGFAALTHNGSFKHEEDAAISLRLIKEAAKSLGYNLVKKPVR